MTTRWSCPTCGDGGEVESGAAITHRCLVADREVSIAAYYKLLGAHYHVRVFAGKNPGARGRLGVLVMDEDDFAAFRDVLEAGAAAVPIQVTFSDESEDA